MSGGPSRTRGRRRADGPDHRLCAEPDQIARAGPALGDGLADRFCDQRWLGEQIAAVILDHAVCGLICHFRICTVCRRLFQIFRGDKTSIGLDPARLHHDDIDAERLQLHPQTVRQALHSVLRRVIPAAELRPDLPAHRGDVDDFLVVLLPHCRGDKPDEPCHAE